MFIAHQISGEHHEHRYADREQGSHSYHDVHRNIVHRLRIKAVVQKEMNGQNRKYRDDSYDIKRTVALV